MLSPRTLSQKLLVYPNMGSHLMSPVNLCPQNGTGGWLLLLRSLERTCGQCPEVTDTIAISLFSLPSFDPSELATLSARKMRNSRTGERDGWTDVEELKASLAPPFAPLDNCPGTASATLAWNIHM